jgi:hypothetical protein
VKSASCRSLCENEAASSVQNNGGTTGGGITGKGFRPGQSGNPGGRPRGLAKATRELVGEDGLALVQLWWDIARDETRRDRDRLEASRLLADRGWGKAPTLAAIEESDPFEPGRRGEGGGGVRPRSCAMQKVRSRRGVSRGFQVVRASRRRSFAEHRGDGSGFARRKASSACSGYHLHSRLKGGGCDEGHACLPASSARVKSSGSHS